MTTITEKELITQIVKNAKTGKWFMGVFTVSGKVVRVKTFGLWVQRLEIDGLQYSIPEQKTQKALSHELALILN